MKKSLYLLLLLTIFPSIAQNSLDEKLINYFKLDRENIHLHLNKTIYSTNETIWFKGYIIEKKESKLNFLTTNVYVRLLDSDKKEIFNKLFYASNGTIIGQFDLDKNLITGDYYIHTYTNYMNNFLEDESTLLKIKIVNSKDKLIEKKNSSSNINIKYAFESGLFLENIDNTIGVNIKDCSGKGIKINQIEVINNKNETITTFATNQEGFGKFDLLNTTSDEYSFRFSYNNYTYSQSLGKPEVEGINLSVNSYAIEGKMLLKVKTNQSTLNKFLNKPFSILIQRNNFANSINFKLDKLTSDFIINKSDLQEGINSVKLLDENSVLVSERIIYNQSLDREKIIVESIIKKGDSISIIAKISNRVANLSISALPINTFSNHNSDHIVSSIAFNNYCDFENTNFNYYFENFSKRKEYELDLVLLHTLKSKYKWNDIMNSVPKETYSFDVGINISGKINQTLNNKEKLKLRLFSINGLNEQTEINEKNEFEFKNVLAIDSTNFHFTLIKNNEKLQNLNIFSRLSNNVKPFIKEPEIKKIECDDFLYSYNTEIDDFPKLENTTQLEGISITEIKKPKLENEREFNNGMAKGYKISDTDYSSYRDILSFIASHGYDVSIEGTGVVIRSRIVRTIMGTSSPAVFLDNSPVYDFSQLQNILLNEIDEIYINKHGYGMGDNGINGSIRIYRKKGFYSPPRTNEVKSKSILITKGFQQLKSYKNLNYENYTQDNFQKNGTIHWIPNIYTNESGNFNFTIPHFDQEKIILNIQGIDNLGQLYYQNIIINVK